jgi:hypothetical protein
VPGVLVLVFLGGGLLLGLVLLGILGYGLIGHLGRLRRAVAEAQGDVQPVVEALRRPAPPGRHRAD